MLAFPETILRLIVAILLGALIGLEREWRYHSAGLRTHVLVALGSTLFTIVSGYGFLSLTRYLHVQVDPTRVASYIIAGIGFLGGGVIYTQEKEAKVKGLTTAASIWMVAAVGMAIGAGMLWEAVISTLLALLVLVGLRYLERYLPGRKFYSQSLQLKADTLSGDLLARLYELCKQHNIEVDSLDLQAGEQVSTIIVSCRVEQRASLLALVSELHNLSGIKEVEIELPSGGRRSAV